MRPAAASLTNLGQPLEVMEMRPETPPGPPVGQPPVPPGSAGAPGR